jgi:hypothetical protein
MSDDDFKILVRDKLDTLAKNQHDLALKQDGFTDQIHKMKIEQTKLKVKIGYWWVGLAVLNVAGDIPTALQLFGN